MFQSKGRRHSILAHLGKYSSRSYYSSEAKYHKNDFTKSKSVDNNKSKIEEAPKTPEKEEEKEEGDWRSMLNKLNQSVKLVEAIPKPPEPEPPPVQETKSPNPPRDFIDLKLEYRRIKIREQCKKLNTKVTLPTRSSWRDRINETNTSAPTSQTSVKMSSPGTERRNLTWGQRRTKVYHIDSDVDVHKFKIIDTIHIKRSQIEAKLAEYNQSQKKLQNDPGDVLMLTYQDIDWLNHSKHLKDSAKEEDDRKDESQNAKEATPEKDTEDDHLIDPNLDGLSLKDNTKKMLTQIAKHMKENDGGNNKVKSPALPKKKKYNSSVDWREELKNRDRARQLEALKNYKMGMPDYKEPEKEKEEKEKVSNVDNVWEKSKSKWDRIKLKPKVRQDLKATEKEDLSKNDEPFKINLRPVKERKTNKTEDKENVKNIARRNSIKPQPKEITDDIIPKSKNQTILEEKETVKNTSRRNSLKHEEKPKQSKNKVNKKLDNDEKQYVIKVINFVAIKVPVEKTPPVPRRRKVERKPSFQKPPIPKEKPPSLPNDEETPEVFVAQECFVEDFNFEIVKMLENDSDSRLKDDLLRDLFIEIINDNPDMRKVNVKKEKVQTCPKPKLPTKVKDEKSFDEKYFQPRRKKIIDFVPETIPLPRKREEVKVEKMKFSTVSDNCITKSLFVGSQYIGQRHQ